MNIYIVIAVIVAVGILIGLYLAFFGTKSNQTEKALALAAMGNFLDAKGIVRDLFELNPDDPNILFTFAKIYGMENDFASEVNYLEKIKANGRYGKNFSALSVNNRIGNIYYQLDMSDQAFFAYIDALNIDPTNMEALMRLSFMAVGQKDFEIASKFMMQIPDEEIRLSSYFVAKGVVSAMLNRDNDFEFFEKAYNLDSKSLVNIFLYALSLGRNRKYNEAINLIKPCLDQVSEDLIRFTILQFLMVMSSSISDYEIAQQYTKKCIEICKRNDWELELSECNSFYGMFCLMQNQIEESAEYLIEAEAARVDDSEIMNLAQYKADLEDGTTQAGKTSARGYNLKHAIKELPDRLFPKERYFEISGLKSSEVINIRGMINGEGKKIISKFSQLTADKISKFNQLKGNQFKNVCTKIITEIGYKVKRELPALETEGANYIGMKKGEDNSLAVIRIRKWKNITLSDVFLSELISAITEVSAEKGYIIGDAELTPGAKKVMKTNQGLITIINGKELEALLNKILK
jgi:tetratricopeptide (TPR) repeat protein